MCIRDRLNSPEDIERYGLNDRSYCVCSCEVALLDKKWDLQAIVQMLKNFLDIIENKHDYHIVNVHSSGTVSYTHLDVYKRQGL